MKRALALLALMALACVGALSLLLDDGTPPAPVRASTAGTVDGPSAPAPAPVALTPRREVGPSDGTTTGREAGTSDVAAAGAPDPTRARVDALTRRLEERPDDVKALLERGHLRLRLADPQGAGRDADQALRLDPTWADAWLLRADVRGALGDLAGAEADRARGRELLRELPVAIVVVGVVVDGADAPLASALVDVQVARGDPIEPTTTGPTGHFRLALAAGTFPLGVVVTAPGHARRQVPLELPLDLRAGVEVDVGRVRLSAAASLRVRLRSRDGAPLAGTVSVNDRLVDAEAGAVVELDDLRPGQVRVTARAPDHPEITVTVRLAAGVTLDLPVVPARPGRDAPRPRDRRRRGAGLGGRRVHGARARRADRRRRRVLDHRARAGRRAGPRGRR